MTNALAALHLSEIDLDIQWDAPIGTMTWFHTTGRADCLILPRSLPALQELIRRCHDGGIGIRVMGSGANLLIDDDGVDGVVVRLSESAFSGFDVQEAADGVAVTMPAGQDLMRAVTEMARQGLDGLSAMAGIPASIGGAVRMNAGGAYGSIADTLTSVTTIRHDGSLQKQDASTLDLSYRHTSLHDQFIASATFCLQSHSPEHVRDRVKEIFAYKKSTQPMADASAGCTFKNPLDPTCDERLSAGRLIDEAGLKGHAVGTAQVSDHHANFLGFPAQGRSADLLALMEVVKERVRDVHGITLEREIVVWSREASP